jgi:hypothetical protein
MNVEAPLPPGIKADRLTKSVVGQILRDPRGETHMHDPGKKGTSPVPRKVLDIPHLPGYGQVDATVYDILDDHGGQGYCDIGIKRSQKLQIEEREVYQFRPGLISYHSGEYDTESELYADKANLSSQNDAEYDQIEQQLERLMLEIENSISS